MANVRFYFGKQAKYDALTERDSLALYFIEDTQRLYKGDVLLATGADATSTASGLMSKDDKIALETLVKSGGGIANLTPIDSSIIVDNGKIGVLVSTKPGNRVSVETDGLFVGTDPVQTAKIDDLYSRLTAVEGSLIGGIRYKGSVDTVDDLPENAAQGDLYEVLEDNSEWCFNGEKWFMYGHTVDFRPVAGDGIEVDGNNISIKIAPESNGLVIVDGALYLDLATATSAGALSAVDKAFIDSIPNTYATIEMVQETTEQVKYNISDTPNGTLVNYGEKEIRIMCPADAEFTKQKVGVGGDPNKYYVTFKTYAPNDNAVGYIEHINGQADSEILTSFSTDKYGRRYQPTWLGVASYDETTDTWSYYGANSTEDKYIGWDYQIDWYDANNTMIASDCIRINLSNEDCHNRSMPYYMSAYATEEQMTSLKATIASMGESFHWGEL